MKITDKNHFVDLEAYIKPITDQRRLGGSPRQPSREVSKEDKVELSPRAKEMQKAKKLLQAIPDVRNEKITLIKKQVEKGTYKVNGEQTAAKMLKESLLNELL
jgi:negative regulator of flagellin synthesis FlgM